jgi:hypothetical protein
MHGNMPELSVLVKDKGISAAVLGEYKDPMDYAG